MLLVTRTLAAGLMMALCSLSTFALGEDQPFTANPLRLSYINGNVSFWRYGAEDWVGARINTPLAVGDAIYTSANSGLELQGEGRGYVRADDNTEIILVNQTPDYLQLKVPSGRVSLDLRTFPSASYTIEVDTPNAVFTIDRTGYYRVDVDGDVHFITRRGGRATVTPAGGQAMTVLPSEEIVVRPGTDWSRAESYVAPELDQWDRWNYDRSNDLADALSDRYLPAGIAGGRDLDHYGNWRLSQDYGQVWVPDAMPVGWAPYSNGRWIWDPYYQWTWVDDAPWGWAPYHYGRWVYLGGYWAWAPGPVVLNRPVYAPALVAFFGGSQHGSASVGFVGSGLGWVALGWGEPLTPWWGRTGFVGRPYWGGWNGPRVVNNVVVRQPNNINVTNIIYANRQAPNGLIATTPDRFGRGHIQGAVDRSQIQTGDMERIRGALPVKPNASNLVGDAPRAVRPPEQITSRPVVATRRPQDARLPWHDESAIPKPEEQRYVPAPKPVATEIIRPDIGTHTGPERSRPAMPPRYEDWKQQAAPVVNNAPRSFKNEPVVTTPSVQPREAIPQNQVLPAAVPVPQAQTLRIESAPRPERSAPAETIVQSRSARDVVPLTPEPIRNLQQERQPRLAAPIAAPIATPVQAPAAQAVKPQGVRPDLPGVPANRTFRKSDQEKSERDHQQH